MVMKMAEPMIPSRSSRSGGKTLGTHIKAEVISSAMTSSVEDGEMTAITRCSPYESSMGYLPSTAGSD